MITTIIKRLLLLTITILLLSHPVRSQTVAVTGTITDTQSTPYSNGLLTVTFVNATGQLATFGGSPSFQKSYSVYLDVNGAFTVNLPPNSTASPSIQPAGTQWNFAYQSQGGYGAANINVTITGSGSISGTLSNLTRITWPYGNIPPPGVSGQGIVFVSSTTLGWGQTSGGLPTGCTSPGTGAITCTGTVTANIGSWNSEGTNFTDIACAAQSVGNSNQDRLSCDGTNWPVVSMNTNAAQKLALSMGVVSYTTSQTLDQSHCGKLVTFNGVSLTATLPAAIINSACVFDVKNLAATSLTIARNGRNVDGQAANPTALAQNKSYRITNDSVDYWTEGPF